MAKTHRICSVPDCNKPHDSHGYCGAHAQRFRRHGDPLGGGTGHHEPRNFLQEVVLPYEGDECLIWPFARDMQGYAKLHVGPVIGRDSKNCLVARLVCEETNGAPPSISHEAAHSCGRGMEGCVTKAHVSWKTREDNEADKEIHGTRHRGEKSKTAKLTAQDVVAIKGMLGTVPQSQIARKFGVSQPTIALISTGKNWAHITL